MMAPAQSPAALLASGLSWWLFFQPGEVGPNQLWWISIPDVFTVPIGMTVDPLSRTMLVVVNTVSAFVHLYSIGYMEEDPHRPRFFAYLSLFTFAMLMLVTADNLVQLFFGWEGVGLAS